MKKTLLLITLLLFSAQVSGKPTDLENFIHISITTPKKETKYDVCFAKNDKTILVTKKKKYQLVESQDHTVEFFNYEKPKKEFYLGLKKRGAKEYSWCYASLISKLLVPQKITHILIDAHTDKDKATVEFRYHDSTGKINTIATGFVKK